MTRSQCLLSNTLAMVLLLTSAVIARAQGANIENGEDVFRKCRACHLIGETARNAVGPALNDIVGRKAGIAEGFAYSDNLRELAQSGLIWTEEMLSRYIENPKAIVPKGKMAFPGLPDHQDRADVIAYLKKFGSR